MIPNTEVKPGAPPFAHLAKGGPGTMLLSRSEAVVVWTVQEKTVAPKKSGIAEFQAMRSRVNRAHPSQTPRGVGHPRWCRFE